MKVLLINGSPRKNGNTATALAAVAKELAAQGIEPSGVVSPVVDAAAHREGCVYSPKTR